MKTAEELARENTEKALKMCGVVCNDPIQLEQAITAAKILLQKAMSIPGEKSRDSMEIRAFALLYLAISRLNELPEYCEVVAPPISDVIKHLSTLNPSRGLGTLISENETGGGRKKSGYKRGG